MVSRLPSSDPSPPPAPPERKSGIPGWARSLIAAAGLAVCAAVMLLANRERPLPVQGSVGEFSLLDAGGQPYGSSDLRGKVWVASFIFTRCRDTCPVMTAKLLLLQDAIHASQGLAEEVRLVSFSVDPERDKPSDMKNYAASFGADTSLWHFLTGAEGIVEGISKQFCLPVGRGNLPGGGQSPEIIHSDRFTLVDRIGRIRGYYHPEPDDMQRLATDLKKLVRENGGSR